jgi:preprotein translocase subunit SecA
MLKDMITRYVAKIAGEGQKSTDWDYVKLNESLMPIFHKPIISKEELAQYSDRESLGGYIYDKGVALYKYRENEFGSERMREIERIVLLRVVDQRWMDHIDDMDQMRQGITLRAFAQRDPLVEYKFLSFDMFEELSNTIQEETVKGLYNVRIATQPEKREQVAKPLATNKDDSAVKAPAKRKEGKVGRNDPCPCGSGLKYKQCHGK